MLIWLFYLYCTVYVYYYVPTLVLASMSMVEAYLAVHVRCLQTHWMQCIMLATILPTRQSDYSNNVAIDIHNYRI